MERLPTNNSLTSVDAASHGDLKLALNIFRRGTCRKPYGPTLSPSKQTWGG